MWRLVGLLEALHRLRGLEANPRDAPRLEAEDKWLLYKLWLLITDLGPSLQRSDYGKAIDELYVFASKILGELYAPQVLRRARLSSETARAAYTTLSYAVKSLIRLAAEFAPFEAEKLYHALASDNPLAPRSVKALPWPGIPRLLLDVDAYRMVEEKIGARHASP